MYFVHIYIHIYTVHVKYFRRYLHTVSGLQKNEAATHGQLCIVGYVQQPYTRTRKQNVYAYVYGIRIECRRRVVFILQN